MTGKQFYENIVNYYGDYNYAQKTVIVSYLRELKEKTGAMFEDYLDKLYNRLLRSYSNRFKIPPDVAEMVKYYTDIIDEISIDRSGTLMLPEVTEPVKEEEWAEIKKRYPKLFENRGGKE